MPPSCAIVWSTTAVELLKAEGFDYEEIAATLGLAKGAIGTTLARARRRLVEAYRAQERARQKERGKNVAS